MHSNFCETLTYLKHQCSYKYGFLPYFLILNSYVKFGDTDSIQIEDNEIVINVDSDLFLANTPIVNCERLIASLNEFILKHTKITLPNKEVRFIEPETKGSSDVVSKWLSKSVRKTILGYGNSYYSSLATYLKIEFKESNKLTLVDIEQNNKQLIYDLLSSEYKKEIKFKQINDRTSMAVESLLNFMPNNKTEESPEFKNSLKVLSEAIHVLPESLMIETLLSLIFIHKRHLQIKSNALEGFLSSLMNYPDLINILTKHQKIEHMKLK